MTRIEMLRKELPQSFEAALIQNDSHRFYLTHFESSAGALVITKKDAVLIIDSRYYESAKESARGVNVVLMDDIYHQMSDIISGSDAKSLMIEDETSVAAFAAIKKGLRAVSPKYDSSNSLSKAILALRAVKDSDELDAIKSAQKITDDAFEYILDYIKPGMTEREIAAELEYSMRKKGADGFAFSTICVSGKNSSKPHGVPTDKKIERGDFITMDFGAKKNGYCSDMTRTVSAGEPCGRQKEIYEIVLEAQSRALKAAAAGISGRALDAAARDYITECGYGKYFGHSLGHSLGIDIHEAPGASRSSCDILSENSIMTIEPGIYIPGEFGVRIEDMVVLKSGGIEDLTHSERKLLVI
ncbi:MAG: aminopeptidase P family protein [Oscillospiraceae bacterium]